MQGPLYIQLRGYAPRTKTFKLELGMGMCLVAKFCTFFYEI